MTQYHAISRLNWGALPATSTYAPNPINVVVTPASLPQNIMTVMNFGVTIRLNAASTGTLAGTFSLQVTDFGVDEKDLMPLATDWVTVAGSSQTWASSPLVYSVSNQGNKWLRVFFINAGSVGNPTVDIAFTGKSWG